MKNTQILRSTQDRSINIVTPASDGGAIESRFVQRASDSIIVYLSSATGCDRACRFCHLTQMGHTMMTHVSEQGYLDQALRHFEMADLEGRLEGVRTVHYNFMARGDALLNPHFVYNSPLIINGLATLAHKYGIDAKFKISTIFPRSDVFEKEDVTLEEFVSATLSCHSEVEFYYSLYSLDPNFRKRWIPKSLNPEDVGDLFSNSVGRLRLHHALIEGENTSVKNMVSIGQWLYRHNIHGRFNIVRYNPFDERCGKEADDSTIELWRSSMEKLSHIIGVKVIEKRGFDVSASCGMFIN